MSKTKQIEEIDQGDWFYEGVTLDGTLEQLEQKIGIITNKLNELVRTVNQLTQL